MMPVTWGDGAGFGGRQPQPVGAGAGLPGRLSWPSPWSSSFLVDLSGIGTVAHRPFIGVGC